MNTYPVQIEQLDRQLNNYLDVDTILGSQSYSFVYGEVQIGPESYVLGFRVLRF